MRVSIAEMIRRPSSLAIVVVAAFLIGAVVGWIGIPKIWRDVNVFVIGNATQDGCSGSAGMTPIRFGRVEAPWDGSYAIPCDGWAWLSDTAAVRCQCPRR